MNGISKWELGLKERYSGEKEENETCRITRRGTNQKESKNAEVKHWTKKKIKQWTKKKKHAKNQRKEWIIKIKKNLVIAKEEVIPLTQFCKTWPV